MAYPVPEEAEDYLDKNVAHVFDMRHLENEIRERFQGDMRIVLDYLSDRESLGRRNQKPRNPEELLRMLHALSGDERYLDNVMFMKEEGGRKMCDLLEEMVEKRRNEMRGLLDEMVEKGREEERDESIKALIITCQEFGASFDETADKVKLRFHLTEQEAEKSMKLYW